MTVLAAKKLLFVFRSDLDYAHLGTGVDAALLAAMFEQEVSLLLVGKAVNLLNNVKQQDNPVHTRLEQMQTCGVSHIYIDTEALHKFPIDLFMHKELLVPVNRMRMKQLIHTHQTVSF